jgi:acyl carrier protein
MTERERIRKFLLNDLGLTESRNHIGEDESLVEGGLIDSLGVLRLVQFIEEEFQIQLSDDDVNVENFDTLASIAQLIETHQPSRQRS